jgi:hypothetical protein
MIEPIDFDSLTDDEFTSLVQVRIARLNAEQQIIAQAREVKRQEQMRLVHKLATATEPETHEMIFNALRDMDSSDSCEHGRSVWKHCGECGNIDHIMFPELFGEDGFLIQGCEEDE